MTNNPTQEQVRHPLDSLTGAEIRATAAAVRAAHPELTRPSFSVIALQEPPKAEVLGFRPGTPFARRARVVVFDRELQTTYRGVVALADGTVEAWEGVPGAQPMIHAEDFELARSAPLSDERFVAALARRGLTPEEITIDGLTPGFYEGYPPGRRCLWAVPYGLPRPGANQYAHPIEHLAALVDVVSGEVLEVLDGEVVPVPQASGDYDAEAAGGLRTDVKRIDITQPDGVSFTVEGEEISWQRWRFRVALDPIEGLVLHDVRYRDGEEERSVLYRAALAEMVVPYGEPGKGFYWRSYFDAGEYGLGQTTNSLKLGCDCLGEIHYFDAVLADSSGEPRTISQAICLHEEDAGMLWKHTDLLSESADVRRARRLVVSAVSTVGNYDYGLFWSFYQDGSIELEVKLTGIVLTQGVVDGQELPHSRRIAADLAAPHHQHLFNIRMDMAVDGVENAVYEVDMVAAEEGPDNPHGGAMAARETLIESEAEARRAVAPLAQRYWKVVNRDKRNAVGAPVGYKLMPHEGPVLLAREGSSVARRAEFARHHLWVTRYDPEEMHAAGDFPNQSPGGDGLERWVAADRSLVDTDVVLWHTLGVSHIVRPEDWPVMPVDKIGFALRPVGFFDRNPGLDVPPGAGSAPADGDSCCR